MMRDEIYDRQTELRMRMTELGRIKKRYEAKEAERQEAKRERDRLQARLTKEQQDVLRLGQFSFANKFRQLTGKMDEIMEKELNEAAEAELKFNEAEKVLLDLEEETAALKTELDRPEYEFLDDDWDAFLQEKEIWMRNNDTGAITKLQQVADERATLQSMRREIEEAIHAGREAQRVLDSAVDQLGNAEGMSMWDTFLGGGMVVTAMKYSSINSSDDKIHRAQRALRRFQSELADVENFDTARLTVNKRDFLNFSDFFFDNMFTDWMVHSRITDAKSQLDGVLADVERILRELADRLKRTDAEIARLAEREKEIILS
ncbi:hypothetical protein [Edaphobacillus lindanitolerans]|uniref:Uncharacterized protein n=1 Tax=Edaphobacillus lindanitolerans TaxID=550447 RepID=A0A1U7PQU0_9BACI|nr:hypothetical protein [Edaphobacillus lindanitolerans]SIT87198.1 hypothetical protein SAMN05428946_2003 [Edaphobacillus lindanitolerans]